MGLALPNPFCPRPRTDSNHHWPICILTRKEINQMKVPIQEDPLARSLGRLSGGRVREDQALRRTRSLSMVPTSQVSRSAASKSRAHSLLIHGFLEIFVS